MFNTIKIKAALNEKKGILKQKIAVITHNDFLLAEGKKDELLGKLQMKYVKAKDNPHNYHSLSVFESKRVAEVLLPSLDAIMSNKHSLRREEFAFSDSEIRN